MICRRYVLLPLLLVCSASAAAQQSAVYRTGDETISAVAASTGGKVVAVATMPGVVRLWDYKSGKFEKRVQLPWKSPSSLAVSPDALFLAAGSSDGQLAVVEVERGRLLIDEKPHSGPVTSIAFSPDGKSLATGGSDGQLRISTLRGKLMGRNKGFESPVTCVAFSPDGKRIAAGYESGDVKIWSVEQRNLERSFGERKEGATCVAFSPDQRHFVAAWGSECIVFDLTRGTKFSQLKQQSGTVTFAGFRRRDHSLVTASRDGSIVVWNPATWTPARRITQTSRIVSVALVGDRAILHAGDLDSKAEAQDLAGDENCGIAFLHANWKSARPLQFSPGGKTIAFALAGSSHVGLWDAYEMDGARRLYGHHGRTAAIAFSPDGKIATSTVEGALYLWTTQSNRRTVILRKKGTVARALAFSLDGKQLYAAGADHLVEIFDAVEGKRVGGIQGHAGGIAALAVLPDGKHLASGGENLLTDEGEVFVWSLQRRKKVARLAHPVPVTALAAAPDGHKLAVAGADASISLWTMPDPNTPRWIRPPRPKPPTEAPGEGRTKRRQKVASIDKGYPFDSEFTTSVSLLQFTSDSRVLVSIDKHARMACFPSAGEPYFRPLRETVTVPLLLNEIATIRDVALSRDAKSLAVIGDRRADRRPALAILPLRPFAE